MSEIAQKIEPLETKKSLGKIEDTILGTHTGELIIGLCGPIGTNIHFVASEISTLVKEKYGYKSKIIKLSDFIKEKKNVHDSSYQGKFEYISALIDKGNELRKENGTSILAELAISEIAVEREEHKRKEKETTFTSNRICYIIDSIKNPDELELFRLVYTDLFYFIGVFSNLELREKNIEKSGIKKDEIYRLIDRDSGEEIKSGQKVSQTFMNADFFLRIEETTSAKIAAKITRFLDLIFSAEIKTPTIYETAMYQAFAAAGNSACLSRQVGAAITNEKGAILSVGWNDVPKYNGGTYNFDENDILGSNDFRCLNLEGGICFNDQEKDLIKTHVIEKLIEEGLIDNKNKNKAVEIIKDSRIKDLIEFSRAVHAEMHAIIVGGQKSGSEIVGGKLFCTTYPCHNCARHIVLAGITEVYYIEPYRKSLAIKLHSDSITEDESVTNRVKVLMFDGVSPRRYLELFKMKSESRKKDGLKINYDKSNILPKTTISLQAIPILEGRVLEDLKNKKLIDTGEESNQ